MTESSQNEPVPHSVPIVTPYGFSNGARPKKPKKPGRATALPLTGTTSDVHVAAETNLASTRPATSVPVVTPFGFSSGSTPKKVNRAPRSKPDRERASGPAVLGQLGALLGSAAFALVGFLLWTLDNNSWNAKAALCNGAQSYGARVPSSCAFYEVASSLRTPAIIVAVLSGVIFAIGVLAALGALIATKQHPEGGASSER